jgi:gas vesicle protein
MSKLYFGYKEDLPKGYKDFGTAEQAQKKGQLRRYGRFLYNEKQLDKIIDKEVDKEINKIIEQPKKQSLLKKEDIVNLKFKYTYEIKQQEKELKLFLKELEEEKIPKYRKEIMNDIEKTEMNIKDLQNKLNELE